MAKTASLIELETRIRDIDATLLPPINPLGAYTSSEQDSIRAFVLLCHAEIESFLEDWAKELLNVLSRELQNPKAGSRFARAYAKKTVGSLPQAIITNHGLKSANLLKMFEPLGFSEADFDAIDSTFLSQMNQFGHRRGESAHCSVNRATKQPDPIQEKKAVAGILSCLERLETEFIRIRISGFLAG